jgi:cellobiose epimerase
MNARALGAAAICILALTGSSAAADVSGRLKKHIPRMEQALTDNVLGFWQPRCLDRKNGGYIINFGLKGEPNGQSTKMIVTQARMVWFYSHMVRTGYGDRRQMLASAEHGYRFLRDKMWDQEHGGFYWEVDATGAPLKPKKHLYGQSFGLYALSEYAQASGRKDVLEMAVQLFRLLEDRAHDKTYGGYIEFFDRDWTEVSPGEPPYMTSGATGLKLMNTHLHLLESVTAFYRASQMPLARERLLELITIESNSVVRKGLVGCTDKYARDWTPQLEGNFARVSYGHDLENIWLLVDACKAAGISTYPLLDLYKDLFAYSLKYGYDQEDGGFYDSGGFQLPADQRGKTWWVEAEAMVSALYMYRLTHEPKYLDVFEKTWAFVDGKQIDWEHGEWFQSITPEGKPSGEKGTIWKAAYHNGRALMECLAILKELSAQ